MTIWIVLVVRHSEVMILGCYRNLERARTRLEDFVNTENENYLRELKKCAEDVYYNKDTLAKLW